jgi:hypothetical protein
MQKLKLAEDIFDQLQAGKRTTIRLGKRDITLGSLLFESNDLKRESIVTVAKVNYCKLKDVSLDDLINDGFSDHSHMLNEMKRFYPEIEMESWVTVVGFQK